MGVLAFVCCSPSGSDCVSFYLGLRLRLHPRLYRFVAFGDRTEADSTSAETGCPKRFLNLHTHILLFSKKLQRLESAFSSDAAVFYSAKGCSEVSEQPTIYPNDARFQ